MVNIRVFFLIKSANVNRHIVSVKKSYRHGKFSKLKNTYLQNYRLRRRVCAPISHNNFFYNPLVMGSPLSYQRTTDMLKCEIRLEKKFIYTHPMTYN